MLGQVTTELSSCSIHQIGSNLDLLSPSSCSGRKYRKEQHKDTTKLHGLTTIIFTCEFYQFCTFSIFYEHRNVFCMLPYPINLNFFSGIVLTAVVGTSAFLLRICHCVLRKMDGSFINVCRV